MAWRSTLCGSRVSVMDFTPFLLFTFLVCQQGYFAVEVHKETRQWKRFGDGPSHTMDEVDGFPESRTFFENYVFKSRPLKMRGAVKTSPAFRLWEDDYFLEMEMPPDLHVTVETMKKENRSQPVEQMHFKEFVHVYNHTNQYLVNSVPKIIAKDIILPRPLQCEEMIHEGFLTEAMMWYSSGGTSSVVHTDSVDNINCLYRGDKEFVFVDPHKYGELVDLDHPEGAYSGIDVDRVDFDKYPGLREVEYYHVNLTAGDCLYIPYKWIHQVRSYNRNIAVNIWWNFHKNKKLDLSQCEGREEDPAITLDKCQFSGFDEMLQDVESIIAHFLDICKTNKEITFEKFQKILGIDLTEEDEQVLGTEHKLYLSEIFRILDADKSQKLEYKEVEKTSIEAWEKVQELLIKYDDLMGKLDEPDENETAEEIRDEL
ncbi:tRNA wybutosine-synthesizing protein 5 [Lingula anatina]|uniref:tRNA wybutosine-synthesizing protein 5 n=1 Tax=Lingula anatina TaxID=7574 RepID=A0A1S3K2A4_LINAN|nr:tRNA wybutosine-synthesizing protein 5 [Lingula anatina]|eukprot:XP_013416768.1 tRNA wybutosine-synthesizing protein 5 [Lingula anatina]